MKIQNKYLDPGTNYIKDIQKDADLVTLTCNNSNEVIIYLPDAYTIRSVVFCISMQYSNQSNVIVYSRNTTQTVCGGQSQTIYSTDATAGRMLFIVSDGHNWNTAMDGTDVSAIKGDLSVSSAIIGGDTNKSVFDTNGFLTYYGSASGYNDIFIDIAPKTTGTGTPTLATFLGNIRKHTFAVGDLTDLSVTEMLHGWEEGSAVEVHVHWATNGANNATVRGVKWEIDYSFANANSAFPVQTTVSTEAVIPANEADKTHRITAIFSFTPTTGKIGSALALSLKRIASVTNVAPINNPFVLMVGIHYKINTIGSKTLYIK